MSIFSQDLWRAFKHSSQSQRGLEWEQSNPNLRSGSAYLPEFLYVASQDRKSEVKKLKLKFRKGFDSPPHDVLANQKQWIATCAVCLISLP